MLTRHAVDRGVQRINTNSKEKNKIDNIKHKMSRDAYRKYFASYDNIVGIFRYVKRGNNIYKYILSPLDKKVITMYKVDNFEYEKQKYNLVFR